MKKALIAAILALTATSTLGAIVFSVGFSTSEELENRFDITSRGAAAGGWSSNGGIGNSSSVQLPDNADTIFTTTQSYSPSSNGSYRLEALVRLSNDPGTVAFGFTNEDVVDVDSALTDLRHPNRLGVAFSADRTYHTHVGEAPFPRFFNDQERLLSEDGTPKWYLVEYLYENRFGSHRLRIYDVDQSTGTRLSLRIEESRGLSEVTSLGNLRAYIAAEGGLMTNLDNVIVDVNVDSTTPADKPTVQVSSETIEHQASTLQRIQRVNFTFSEETADFTPEDVSVVNGTVDANSFTGTGNSYSADIHATDYGRVEVRLDAGVFSGASAERPNQSSNSFIWTFSDISRPEGLDPTQANGVIDSISSMHNATNLFTAFSTAAVGQRLGWLKRNSNPDLRSHQGIEIRFESPLINDLVHGPRQQQMSLHQVADVLNSDTQAVERYTQKKLSDASIAHLRERLGLDQINLNPSIGPLIDEWSAWSHGQISLGKVNKEAQDYESMALAFGIDRPMWGDKGTLGLSMSLGQNEHRMSQSGSENTSESLSFSAYFAYSLGKASQIEAILGGGSINFETLRIDSAQRLHGQRSADLGFVSLTLRQSFELADYLIYSPYATLEGSYARLEAFTETGGDRSIHFGEQETFQSRFSLGQTLSLNPKRTNTRWQPYGTLELGTHMNHTSDTNLNYADDSSLYAIASGHQRASHWKAGLGLSYQPTPNTRISTAYQRTESFNRGHSDQLSAEVSVSF